jgi:dTDP-4-amino-4,6-dideoxygalactose transaminase
MTEIHKPLKEEFMSEVEELLNTSNFVFGTEKFEEDFADFTGAKYCVAVNSGTSALAIALYSAGIRSGDKVTTVSHTFTATLSAIRYLGAYNEYVDIDEKTYCMDPEKLNVGFDNKVILPVHMYGNACDMTRINSKKSVSMIIEDCSQAHGTRINGKHVGTFGDAGTFSFYPGKGIGAFGDAGCVITDDEGLAEEMREQRSWKENDIGFNMRMSNINARFISLKLKYYPEVLREKQEIADYYNKHLDYCYTQEGVEHSYHIYPILHRDRNKLIERCSNDLQLKKHYDKPVHANPLYRMGKTNCTICNDVENIVDIDLPVTEKISNSQVSLPIYPGVNKEKVIDILQKYWSNGNGVSSSVL